MKETEFLLSARERLMRCERLSAIETLRLLALAEAGRQQWVPVSEKLPEFDIDVHLWAEGWDAVYVGYWRHSEEWIGRYRAESDTELPTTNPTHWQSLAAPPSARALQCKNPHHALTDGSPSPHETSSSCMADAVLPEYDYEQENYKGAANAPAVLPEGQPQKGSE